MSGYASRQELVDMIKLTIETDHNGTGMSRDPKHYNISGIIREGYEYQPNYGWRAKDIVCDDFVGILRRNLRKNKPTRETFSRREVYDLLTWLADEAVSGALCPPLEAHHVSSWLRDRAEVYR